MLLYDTGFVGVLVAVGLAAVLHDKCLFCQTQARDSSHGPNDSNHLFRLNIFVTVQVPQVTQLLFDSIPATYGMILSINMLYLVRNLGPKIAHRKVGRVARRKLLGVIFRVG